MKFVDNGDSDKSEFEDEFMEFDSGDEGINGDFFQFWLAGEKQADNEPPTISKPYKPNDMEFWDEDPFEMTKLLSALPRPPQTFEERENAFSSEIRRTDERTEEQWILDSGASAHMTYNLNYFDSLSDSTENEVIRFGNNVELPVKEKGDVKIKKLIHGKWQEGEIQNVLYVPDLKKNLLSEGVIATKGMKIIKMHDYADIYNCENELVGTAVRSANNLYHMLFRTVTYPEVNISHKNNLKIWYERTGHINLKALCDR
ncbi:hypothetical protein AVEN_238224-1 [Araneus ventricosus]|uniref:Retrovirus-related Pol polyprotein from transposon TNT 1-94-like beta-barrel domain-containing protein n=1 Tax=Araneus ventricosus TaxID=182803 RepID=A0A4Y2I538_ARAVE|nr:hypothetical protein AVEN_238224-1 [Araneus ventricosus]